MEKISEFFSEYKEYILFGVSIILFLVLSFLLFYYFRSNINILENKIEDKQVEVEKEEEKKDNKLLAVDIKGEVKKPGVYFLEQGKRVIDVVKKAGGFTKNANSFVNNLSMSITDEMVIVIYSNSEIDDYLSTKEKESKVIEKCKTEIITNNSCIDKSDDNKAINNSSSDTDNSKAKEENKVEENDSNKKISINNAKKKNY